MCQYSKNCKNFTPSKRNSVNCRILCARNPLLDYELPNEFTPVRALTKEEKNLDFEMSPVSIIKDSDDFNESEIKAQLEKIRTDKSIPDGVKRDRVQDILIKRGIIQSTGGEELDTRNLPKQQKPKPLSESLKLTDKREKEMEETGVHVKDSISENQDVTGWKAPRRRGKGSRS
jgi:hypothetical protein